MSDLVTKAYEKYLAVAKDKQNLLNGIFEGDLEDTVRLKEFSFSDTEALIVLCNLLADCKISVIDQNKCADEDVKWISVDDICEDHFKLGLAPAKHESSLCQPSHRTRVDVLPSAHSCLGEPGDDESFSYVEGPDGIYAVFKGRTVPVDLPRGDEFSSFFGYYSGGPDPKESTAKITNQLYRVMREAIATKGRGGYTFKLTFGTFMTAFFAIVSRIRTLLTICCRVKKDGPMTAALKCWRLGKIVAVPRWIKILFIDSEGQGNNTLMRMQYLRKDGAVGQFPPPGRMKNSEWIKLSASDQLARVRQFCAGEAGLRVKLKTFIESSSFFESEPSAKIIKTLARDFPLDEVVARTRELLGDSAMNSVNYTALIAAPMGGSLISYIPMDSCILRCGDCTIGERTALEIIATGLSIATCRGAKPAKPREGVKLFYNMANVRDFCAVLFPGVSNPKYADDMSAWFDIVLENGLNTIGTSSDVPEILKAHKRTSEFMRFVGRAPGGYSAFDRLEGSVPPFSVENYPDQWWLAERVTRLPAMDNLAAADWLKKGSHATAASSATSFSAGKGPTVKLEVKDSGKNEDGSDRIQAYSVRNKASLSVSARQEELIISRKHDHRSITTGPEAVEDVLLSFDIGSTQTKVRLGRISAYMRAKTHTEIEAFETTPEYKQSLDRVGYRNDVMKTRRIIFVVALMFYELLQPLNAIILHMANILNSAVAVVLTPRDEERKQEDDWPAIRDMNFKREPEQLFTSDIDLTTTEPRDQSVRPPIAGNTLKRRAANDISRAGSQHVAFLESDYASFDASNVAGGLIVLMSLLVAGQYLVVDGMGFLSQLGLIMSSGDVDLALNEFCFYVGMGLVPIPQVAEWVERNLRGERIAPWGVWQLWAAKGSGVSSSALLPFISFPSGLPITMTLNTMIALVGSLSGQSNFYQIVDQCAGTNPGCPFATSIQDYSECKNFEELIAKGRGDMNGIPIRLIGEPTFEKITEALNMYGVKSKTAIQGDDSLISIAYELLTDMRNGNIAIMNHNMVLFITAMDNMLTHLKSAPAKQSSVQPTFLQQTAAGASRYPASSSENKIVKMHLSTQFAAVIAQSAEADVPPPAKLSAGRFTREVPWFDSVGNKELANLLLKPGVTQRLLIEDHPPPEIMSRELVNLDDGSGRPAPINVRLMLRRYPDYLSMMDTIPLETQANIEAVAATPSQNIIKAITALETLPVVGPFTASKELQNSRLYNVAIGGISVLGGRVSAEFKKSLRSSRAAIVMFAKLEGTQCTWTLGYGTGTSRQYLRRQINISVGYAGADPYASMFGRRNERFVYTFGQRTATPKMTPPEKVIVTAQRVPLELRANYFTLEGFLDTPDHGNDIHLAKAFELPRRNTVQLFREWETIISSTEWGAKASDVARKVAAQRLEQYFISTICMILREVYPTGCDLVNACFRKPIQSPILFYSEVH